MFYSKYYSFCKKNNTGFSFVIILFFIDSIKETAWSYGVVVSTQDFEFCDLGSNPGRTFLSKLDRGACRLLIMIGSASGVPLGDPKSQKCITCVFYFFFLPFFLLKLREDPDSYHTRTLEANHILFHMMSDLSLLMVKEHSY